MSEQSFAAGAHPRRPGQFVERLSHGLVQAMEHALDAESMGERAGFLQSLDPRIKLCSLLVLIISSVATRSLWLLALLFMLAVVLALASRITIVRLGRQVWLSVLLFTGVIALPSLLIVPGVSILEIPWLHWQITRQGVVSASFLIGRAETCATFALLLILTTPWTHVLKAMRSLGAPVVLVAILGMTHRYIFVLLNSALQMFEARRSRLLAPLSAREQRKLALGAAGVLLGKSLQLSTEVHLAMVSRGYRGEIYLLDEFRTRPRDWLALAGALLISILLLWIQS